MSRLLPKHFYVRDVLEVAPELIGMHLHRGGVALRITEVEAYRWPGDTACHARHGRTARNAPLWGPPGRAYVYLCYGIHNMLNIVTGSEGEAAAILIRAAEPVKGLATIRRRRNGLEGPGLLSGPGKVGAALELDVSWSHHPLHTARGLEVRAGRPATNVISGVRIGVDYAEPEHRDAPWRFADGDSAWVSHRNKFIGGAKRSRKSVG